MLSRRIATLVAMLVILLFGFAVGGAVRPIRDVRDPLLTAVATASTPLAAAEATLTALAPPEGVLNIATVKSEFATIEVEVTTAASTLTALAGTVAALETAVITPTPTPTSTATPLPTATNTATATSSPSPTTTPTAPPSPTAIPTTASTAAGTATATPRSGAVTPTRASVAGSGATRVPTVSSGKVEVVRWGGPFNGWLPVIVVNGTDQPVLIESVKLIVDGKDTGIGTYFAPAFLQPGQESVGTLTTRIESVAGLSGANFRIEVAVPTAGSTLSYDYEGAPAVDGNGSLTATIRFDRQTGDPRTAVLKGICFSADGTISGMFWKNVSEVIDSKGLYSVVAPLIGPGPCLDPIYGIAT